MRSSLLLALAAAVLASACELPSPSTPSPGPFRFSGSVSSMDGARAGSPIAGAQLTVVKGPNVDANVSTGADGRYAFEALGSGRFTVMIAAPGYVSATPVIDLYRDLDVNFALKQQ